MKTWIIYWIGLTASQALASGNPPGNNGIEIENPLSCNDWGKCLSSVLGFMIKLAIPIVSIMIIIGGFQIMSATGNEEKLKKGKDTIVYAVVGFAIILLARGVASVIQSIVSPGS